MRLTAAAALLALAVPLLVRADEDEVAIGQPAPGFTLPTLNPEVAGVARLGLDRYVGPDAEDGEARLVLLTFFASWCQPCQKEMPFLVQLDARLRSRGLRIVAVDIDGDREGQEKARAQLAAAKVTYPVCADRFNLLARRYLGDKAPLPSVFLIRRDGTIARIERGYAKDASAFLLAAVEAELAGPKVGAAGAAGRR